MKYKKTGWYILMRARDHIVKDRTIPLKERSASIELVDNLLVDLYRQTLSWHDKYDQSEY